jgi:threonine/homoserine/homoserine lactone efflux protein
MEFSYLLRGLLLGFSIAAPVGPIGVLCIRRTLAEGRWIGFVSGLGAATADGFYGSIAAFGLTALSGLLIQINTPLRLLGGCFLCYLGYHTFRGAVANVESTDKPAAVSRLGAYISTLFLTLTNPLTILSFAGIYAGLGLAGRASDSTSVLSALALVAGTFFGSVAWWLTLTTLVAAVKQRLNTAALQWVNHLSGVVIIAFGVTTLVGLFST